MCFSGHEFGRLSGARNPQRWIRNALFGCCSTVLVVSSCNRSAAPEQAPFPDLVLITLDTTRADHLGCYGYHRATSPALDELATEALLFERHIVPMATTLPTHVSLLTAVYPIEHGVVANVKDGGRPIVSSSSLQLFAEFAKDLGVRTAGFVSAAPLKVGSGIERGFGVFDQPAGPERRADETTEAALDWLEQVAEDEALFLWIHYFDAHNPFEPPAELADRFSDDELIEDYLTERDFAKRSRRRRGKSVKTRDAIDAYDAEILHVDQQLGRLLAQLRQQPRWERTTVVVVGDHGEGLGQHGIPGHGLTWNEQIHAPLIVRVPGHAPRRIERVVSTVDVLPTVLELCDYPDRQSFLKQAYGRDVVTDGAPRPVLSTTTGRRAKDRLLRTEALTSGTWKLIVDEEGRETFFDLHTDPFELNPIDQESPERSRLRLEREALLDEISRRAELHEPSRTAPMNLEELDALRQLGYVDGGEQEDESPR